MKKIKKIKSLKKKFKRNKNNVGSSSIEKEFKLFLNSIGIEVDTQFEILYKFYDFIIKNSKILIEIDGGYFHCDKRLYPNGPINKMQKKSIINDNYKNSLAKIHGYYLIIIWEKDFNEDKEKVKKYIFEEIEKINKK